MTFASCRSGGAQRQLSLTQLVGQGGTVRDVGGGRGKMCTVMHGRDEIQEGLLLFLVPTLFFFFSQPAWEQKWWLSSLFVGENDLAKECRQGEAGKEESDPKNHFSFWFA